MAFAKLTDEELGRIAREVLTALQRADLHPIPDPKGLTFSEMTQNFVAFRNQCSYLTVLL